MTKKEIAVSFLKLVGSGSVDEAFTKYMTPNFIHHNQYFHGSCGALQKAMEEAHQASPNIAVEIKYSYDDGDTVITHSLIVKKDMEIAVVHIFRFSKNKIIELWDLGQIILKDSPNENGLF
jgi:predicted SnoaL-like aldol condensation-catalyzing enzyme